MGQTVCIILSSDDRARIVLLSGDCLPVLEVSRQTGASRPAVWRHAIADNYATHKHPKVKEWLADHPRWVFHFTPTSGSWLNAVEGFFSVITRRRIRRGAFNSVPDLTHAIERYIREHNKASKPFVWTKSAATILAKLDRLRVPSE